MRHAVRHVTSREHAALVRAIERYRTELGTASQHAPRTVPDYVAKFTADRGNGGLVVVSDDDVIGLLLYDRTSGAGTLAFALEVLDFWVASEWRRRGVGSALLRAAADVARDSGCDRLYLLADADRRDLHAFYSANGLAMEPVAFWRMRVS